MRRRGRSAAGSMLVLTICVTALIFIPLLMFASSVAPYYLSSERVQNIVEAASNVAAMDLSRIVIDDPTFGYVSLSNHDAVGKRTLAADGEPLPVCGINTLIGTTRQNAIIADELHNATMERLVDDDLAAVNAAACELHDVLSESISGDPMRKPAQDINGEVVRPYQHVEQFLTENLPPNVRVQSLKLSLGWMENGSGTTIPIPQPASLARVPKRDLSAGKYTPFVNYPVGTRNFSFAGLGTQTHLVSTRDFRPDDGKHISSIVRIECTFVMKNQPNQPIVSVACCQPFSHPDKAVSGAMTIRFSGQAVPGLSSWRELLSSESFYDRQINHFDVSGDYPFQHRSRMDLVAVRSENTPYAVYSPIGRNGGSTSDEFAEHLYCWLRNGRLHPRIDAILAMINEPFSNNINQVYCYEFAGDGSITRKAIDGGRFARAVVADAQTATMSDTRIRSGASAIIMFRDSVNSLGPTYGQHGGQPLCGYPLGEVSGALNYDEVAAGFSKRHDTTSGLALDIEIGGTGQSTAANDVISMRRRTVNRAI